MYTLKVVLVGLAVIALCSAEAAKKSTKKSEKTTSKPVKPSTNEKDLKPQKRGLYPDPVLGSTYAVPGAAPEEVYHASPALLSDPHDLGVYGGVYSDRQQLQSPVVLATYAPRYGFGSASQGSYSSYGHGFLGGFPGGLRGLEAVLGGVRIEEGTIRIRTVTTHVPVPVPHPVPVEVVKKVPVPVPHAVPVDVPRAVPVEVPQPYPVEVPKPYPVVVPKPVPQAVPHPVHVKVPQPYPVEVPTPYTVEVHRPVPVPVPHHVEVPKPVFYQAPQQSYSAPVYKSYAPSYSVAPSYTVAKPVISVKKCDDDHGYDHFLAKDILSVSVPKVPSGGYADYSSPAPAVYGYQPVPSYPKAASFEYGYSSAPAPSPSYPSYDQGYDKGVATSYVGVTAHGASTYKREVRHN